MEKVGKKDGKKGKTKARREPKTSKYKPLRAAAGRHRRELKEKHTLRRIARGVASVNEIVRSLGRVTGTGMWGVKGTKPTLRMVRRASGQMEHKKVEEAVE